MTLWTSTRSSTDCPAPTPPTESRPRQEGATAREPPGIAGRAAQSARQRQTVIAANAELRERELIKLASLASALTDALRRRGATGPAATLAAEAGIAVFRVAVERWVNETNRRDLPELIRESLEELKAVTAGR